MTESERQEARKWLTNLAAMLEPWRLVLVSGNDLFAAALVWTYPGEIRRVDSLAALRAVLMPQGAQPEPQPQATEKQELEASQEPEPEEETAARQRDRQGGCLVLHSIRSRDLASLRPLPQQLLPIRSVSPGALAADRDCLFFLLCDDLPDGELEEALELLQDAVDEPRRRVLSILADSSERKRLRQQQAAGVDGLCTLSSLGQGRIFTALAAIACGGVYVDPRFHRRLVQSGAERLLVGSDDLEPKERQLLREICRGYNSREIADRHGQTRTSVRRHLSHTYQRIGVRDRAQAIGWCVAHGLIEAAELQRIYLPQLGGGQTTERQAAAQAG